MSLIEEALRKQREESEKSGGTPVAAPPTPTPDPEPVQEQPTVSVEEPARRPWALLAIIASGSLIAVLIGVWLLVYGLKLWQTKPEASPVKSMPTNRSPAPSVASSPNIQSNEPAKGAAITLPSPVVKPEPVPLPTPVENVPAQPVVAPDIVPVTTNTSVPRAPQVTGNMPPPSPTPTPPKLELPVVWPKITVSGIIGSTKSGRSAAILNGQMLSSGDTIEGVTLESIDKQKVKLKFEGEVKLLAVGASTE